MALALLLLCGSGCGAKTGLKVPDASPDAETVALVDAAINPQTECVELDFMGKGAVLPLQTTAEVGRADVQLLMDVSGSMEGEIAALRRELRDRIVPGIRAEIPDVQFGVASFSDFPEEPFGMPGDAPFRQRVTMTADITDVQGGVDALSLEDGRDLPEAQVEALYQLATGAGLQRWIEPSFGCATGGVGYPCFRPDALPVILLFTDARMHGGPAGAPGYAGLSPPPHTYEEARRALVEHGIRVMGFSSGMGRADLEGVALDTGAVDDRGVPLVFPIGPDGSGLGTDIIDAIKLFTDTLIFDVDLVIRDADPSDGIDATQFIERIVPVSAEPASGVKRIEPDTGFFRQVRSGTRLVYEVQLRNDAVAPGSGLSRFRLTGTFRADGREVLGERAFEIFVPGEGERCDMSSQQ